jgi:hypothetical protein
MTLSKLNACIGAVSLFLLVSSMDAASADAATYNLNGYPCKVYTYSSTSSYSVTMYSGASCTGSYIANPSVRTTFWGGAEGHYEAMLSPMIAATANDTRITGTYSTSVLFGYTYYLFDNLQFNAN